jgi:hypothetical protein
MKNENNYIGCIVGWSNYNGYLNITDCDWDKQTCKYGAVGEP